MVGGLSQRWRSLLVAALSAVMAAVLMLSIVLLAPRDDADAQLVNDSFVILLDVSGSMNRASSTDPTRSRLEVAQSALVDAVGQITPGEINLGLRAFSGCSAGDSTLIAPVQPANPGLIISEIQTLDARGGTGIETALRDAISDFPVTGGRNVVVLVSDGAETCGGDPCQAMADLVANGVNVVVNTIGFQTTGSAAEPQLACIANVTGGTSVAVDDGSTLFDEVTNAIEQCTLPKALCYAPEVRFHPNEGFFPMDPADFVRGSRLRWAANALCFDDTVASKDELTVNSLNNHFWYEVSNTLCRLQRDKGRIFSTDYTRPSFKGDPNNPAEVAAPNGAPRAVKLDGKTLSTAEGFFLDSVDPGQPRGVQPVGNVLDAPTYVVDRGGQVEYWFFYGFDPKSDFDPLNPPPGNVPPVLSAIDGALAHEGDWERVIVTFDANDEPTLVTYFGHGCIPFRIPWDQVEKASGTHPVVYVAEGSHASFPMQRQAGVPWEPDPGCGMGQSGRTDSALFVPGQSAVWQTWTGQGLVDPATQPWYGFGGAWGETGAILGVRGDATGPAGLPFQGSGAGPIIPIPGPAGRLDVGDQVTFEWLAPGTFQFVDGLAGLNYVVVLESLPQIIGRGSYDAAGTANGSFVIPDGTAPGLHTIVIRNAGTGEVLGSYPIWVEIPPSCVPASAADDIDGDGVANSCDNRPGDGPLADADGDGVANATDNCPTIANPGQEVEGQRIVGMACNSVRGINPVPSYADLTPAAVAVPSPAPASTPAPAALVSPIALSVDQYTCAGALAGRATGGSTMRDVEIVFERGDGATRSFLQTVGSNGVFSVSPTLLSVMAAGSWTVTVTAADAAGQVATAESVIDLRHDGCTAPGGAASGVVVAPTPTPTPVPTEAGAGLVPIVLSPTRPSEPNGVVGSGLVAATRGPIVIRIQRQPAALPSILLEQTTAPPATQSVGPVLVDRPGLRLAMTGSTTALTAGWGVLLIGLGTMILRSPWRRRGVSN